MKAAFHDVDKRHEAQMEFRWHLVQSQVEFQEALLCANDSLKLDGWQWLDTKSRTASRNRVLRAVACR